MDDLFRHDCKAPRPSIRHVRQITSRNVGRRRARVAGVGWRTAPSMCPRPGAPGRRRRSRAIGRCAGPWPASTPPSTNASPWIAWRGTPPLPVPGLTLSRSAWPSRRTSPASACDGRPALGVHGAVHRRPRIRLRRETRDLGGTGHRIAQIAVDSGVPDVKALNTAFRPHLRAHAPAFRRLLTADAAATGSVFHQQHYASHHDETVMRAPRTWAARATTDETAPCAMIRGSDPVETHRRSRWYYGLSSAVDTGGRLLCNRFGHAPPE